MSRRRAYTPKRETRDLRRAIAGLVNVTHACIMAPHRGTTVTPARIHIGWADGTYDSMSLAQARRTLAANAEMRTDR
jgi:hypothetical protein